MRRNLGKFLLRLLFIPVSGFFAFHLFTLIGNFINDIFYAFTEDSYELYLRFDTRESVILCFFAIWLAVYLSLELFAYFSNSFRFKRLLTNFRYAPIVVLFASTFIIIAFDFGMIEYSKWEIRSYVFNSAESVVPPDLNLHNNYRGWCGNGYPAQENYLYFDAASEGINDESPYVRARSLLMSREVQNWLNGGDKRFNAYLAKSCRESEGIVFTAAESLLNKSNSNCEKYLSKK